MSNTQDLINFLESRHSVREYLPTSIEEAKRKVIVDLINEINREHHTKFQVFFDKPEAFKGLFLKHTMKECSNIVVFYHKNPVEAGYYSAKVMLKIQEIGLNSCYVGASYHKSLFETNDLTIQCALAFGYGSNSGKPHKNKDLEDILEIHNNQLEHLNLIAAAALSAPTAMNSQRFKLIVKNNDVEVKLNGKGPFAEFDLGIVKYFVELIQNEEAS